MVCFHLYNAMCQWVARLSAQGGEFGLSLRSPDRDIPCDDACNALKRVASQGLPQRGALVVAQVATAHGGFHDVRVESGVRSPSCRIVHWYRHNWWLFWLWRGGRWRAPPIMRFVGA